MKQLKPFLFLFLLALTGPLIPSPSSAACGTVTIAEMNWASAQAVARVDEFILQHGFGCQAETVPGDTMPTAASMTEKSRPDVAPELWLNSIRQPIEKAVAEGRLVIAGEVLEDPAKNAGEGWWIPRYLLQKHPELATIEGVKRRPDLFKDPEDPSRGRVLGCPAGWACQISTDNLFKAFGMKDAGFNLVDPGSGAALAGAISRAYNRQEGVLSYYWAPTSLLARLDMVRVQLAPFDAKAFEDCIGVANCANPQPNNFPVSEIKTVVSARFAKANPGPMVYFEKRVWNARDFGEILRFMEDKQADGVTAARHFLKTKPETWRQWVPADVAARVQAAL